MESTFKKYLILFLTFFKIGLFTFGGGYAMIPLIQQEVTDKKKWMRAEEVADIIAISEATPGPLSINAATYVGYRVAGVLGTIFATIGLVIPSFVIIFIISLFLDQFMQIEIINHAFMGIKAAVALLVIMGSFISIKAWKKILSLSLFSSSRSLYRSSSAF
ncbi:MAG: chromate transporter [Bacilli bacterium]|jgi:chromate transporter